MTTTIPFISANAPQLLAPLEEIARGMVAAVKYYERHGIRADQFDDDGDDPQTDERPTPNDDDEQNAPVS